MKFEYNRPHTADSILRRFLARLFPPHCLICFDNIALGQGLCSHCRAFMQYPHNTCPRCLRQMPSAELCGPCAQHPPGFDQVIAAFKYMPPLVPRIHDIKFSGQFVLLEAAGICLAQEVFAHGSRPDLVIPVPLHAQRLSQRGFDQAVQLARVVVRELHLPKLCFALERTRATAAQTTLATAERRNNVKAAFRSKQIVANRRVALVDDVMTTGATCNEAAKCLRQAGASSVEVWVLARA